MKNLLLLAAFGLLASPAFAQNTATVGQTGSGHTADVEQTGSNTATIDQGGASQSADVEQIGSGNSVNSLQDTGAATNRDNEFVGFQDGENNVVEQTQRGRNQVTTTYQFGSSNRIATESGDWGVDNQGIGNETTISQVGDDNEALSRSEGNSNVTTITQGDDVDGSYGSSARIRTNDGHRNTATINQFGTNNDAGAYIRASENTVNIDQIGNNNVADLDGGSWGAWGVNLRGSFNDVDVWQEGDGNEAYVRIGASSGADGHSTENTVDIRQEDDGNMAEVIVAGDSHLNFVEIDQFNSNNVATSFQAGSGHSATIWQSGDGNEANVQQNN